MRRNKLLNEFTPMGLVILSATAVVVILLVVLVVYVVSRFYG